MFEPTNQVILQLAPLAADAPERVLLIAPLGTGATGTADEPRLVQTLAAARDWLGASPGVPAADLWFRSGLSASRELWLMGVSTQGWTANAWTFTVAAGTATSAGTLTVRFGDFTLPVQINLGDDEDAVAAAIAAAFTNRTDVPATGASAAAVATITTTYLGLETNRYPMTVNLNADRGESLVPGLGAITVASTDAGAGIPTFDASNATEAFAWWLHGNRDTAWLDALDAHLESEWNTQSNFAHSFTAFAEPDSATALALTSARNDAHITALPTKDRPRFELSSAMDLLIRVLRNLDLPAGAGGFSSQAMPLEGPAPTLPNFNAESFLEAGQSPLQATGNGAVQVVRAVTGRTEDDQGAADLRRYDLATVLRARELGNRLRLYQAGLLDRVLVDPGTTLSDAVAPRATDTEAAKTGYTEVLQTARADGLIRATEDAVDAAVVAVNEIVSGGVASGLSAQIDLTFAANVVEIRALVSQQ